MIPADQYTFSVIALLTFLGLLGMAKPRWFIKISRFPFIFPRIEHPPLTATRLRHARAWGVLCLVGAVLLAVLAG